MLFCFISMDFDIRLFSDAFSGLASDVRLPAVEHFKINTPVSTD